MAYKHILKGLLRSYNYFIMESYYKVLPLLCLFFLFVFRCPYKKQIQTLDHIIERQQKFRNNLSEDFF